LLHVQSNISQSLFAGLKQGDDRLSVCLPDFGLVEECPAHPGARIFKRAADNSPSCEQAANS
jgi:hypothetical protein